ncbi:hypothetical protein GGTG_04840 [Gaeumannomyces tritici R3-111a-1]|uniref:Uncharacterized protein n=1 Tax=Gaeumannomyces tritici (strain R3-111a-1) TaxID=644352 RepID=J3NU85_GAET3|nr:hypothetical protein GGTG_04840 [Gaeumannomyces tritici R3-111a-1]EJT79756.1 hypothetical protein GGTG_04840 [Gaeumannomyces tritici R3-111a-1]
MVTRSPACSPRPVRRRVKVSITHAHTSATKLVRQRYFTYFSYCSNGLPGKPGQPACAKAVKSGFKSVSANFKLLIKKRVEVYIYIYIFIYPFRAILLMGSFTDRVNYMKVFAPPRLLPVINGRNYFNFCIYLCKRTAGTLYKKVTQLSQIFYLRKYTFLYVLNCTGFSFTGQVLIASIMHFFITIYTIYFVTYPLSKLFGLFLTALLKVNCKSALALKSNEANVFFLKGNRKSALTSKTITGKSKNKQFALSAKSLTKLKFKKISYSFLLFYQFIALSLISFYARIMQICKRLWLF